MHRVQSESEKLRNCKDQQNALSCSIIIFPSFKLSLAVASIFYIICPSFFVFFSLSLSLFLSLMWPLWIVTFVCRQWAGNILTSGFFEYVESPVTKASQIHSVCGVIDWNVYIYIVLSPSWMCNEQIPRRSNPRTELLQPYPRLNLRWTSLLQHQKGVSEQWYIWIHMIKIGQHPWSLNEFEGWKRIRRYMDQWAKCLQARRTKKGWAWAHACPMPQDPMGESI